MLMFTSLGFISGSMVTDTIARKVLRSYKRMLLLGQGALFLFMCGFLGPVEHLPLPVLAVIFYLTGVVVSSGVMIYPIVRAMFPVSIVGTALTSLNFFVLMGAATTQHIMGAIIGGLKRGGWSVPQSFHAAFLFPVAGLAVAVLLFLWAKDYSDL